MLLKYFNKGREHIIFVKDRPGHDRKYVVNCSKTKDELDWEPEHNFSVWLEKTIEWYSENQWWLRPLKEKAEALYQKMANDRTKKYYSFKNRGPFCY